MFGCTYRPACQSFVFNYTVAVLCGSLLFTCCVSYVNIVIKRLLLLLVDTVKWLLISVLLIYLPRPSSGGKFIMTGIHFYDRETFS